MAKSCKGCGSSTKKLNQPGPRCLGCWRAEKIKRRRRDLDKYYLKTYNMSLAEYDALYDFQGGKCFICRRATGRTKRLAVEHDHSCCPTTPTCGECTRGLICGPDNQMLGRSGDDPEFFKRAAEYLTHTPYRRWKDHNER